MNCLDYHHQRYEESPEPEVWLKPKIGNKKESTKPPKWPMAKQRDQGGTFPGPAVAMTLKVIGYEAPIKHTAHSPG